MFDKTFKLSTFLLKLNIIDTHQKNWWRKKLETPQRLNPRIASSTRICMQDGRYRWYDPFLNFHFFYIDVFCVKVRFLYEGFQKRRQYEWVRVIRVILICDLPLRQWSNIKFPGKLRWQKYKNSKKWKSFGASSPSLSP